MHKVVVDANVILSGILFGGKPARLLEMIVERKFILCLSQQPIDEVFDKLINKFKVSSQIVNDVSIILLCGEYYVPRHKIKLVQDPKNAYLLELAHTACADFIITGDKKHLLPIRRWKSINIISPAQALNIFL